MSKLANTMALCAILLGAATTPDAGAQWSTDALSVPRTGACAVSADGKAYFAGGNDGSGVSDVVEVYDEATGTWSFAPPLSVARQGIAGATAGQYVLLAGGVTSNTTSVATVDFLDTQTMTWGTHALSQARYTAGTSVGNKAIFAGGYEGGPFSPTSSDRVDIYDADLGAPDDPAAWSISQPLSVARGELCAATAGDRALFAGGRDDSLMAGVHEYDTVDIYDNLTDSWSTGTLSQARTTIGAASAGTRACFAGGGYGNMVSDDVDVYDSVTDTWWSGKLSSARSRMSAAALGDLVFMAGGFAVGGHSSSIVDVVDLSTLDFGPATYLSENRGSMAATTVGGKALFAGGFGAQGITGTVDVNDSTWTDLWNSLTGFNGDPLLVGAGSLETGSAGAITLSNAAPSALAVLFASLSSNPAPFKCGLLVPLPILFQVSLTSDGSGDATLPWASWPAGLSGFDLYFQYAIQDPAAVCGAALSNALRADVP